MYKTSATYYTSCHLLTGLVIQSSILWCSVKFLCCLLVRTWYLPYWRASFVCLHRLYSLRSRFYFWYTVAIMVVPSSALRFLCKCKLHKYTKKEITVTFAAAIYSIILFCIPVRLLLVKLKILVSGAWYLGSISESSHWNKWSKDRSRAGMFKWFRLWKPGDSSHIHGLSNLKWLKTVFHFILGPLMTMLNFSETQFRYWWFFLA